ncbi:MAG: hypothetical protein ABL958_20855 [Bdellovibrionia bacterium]
MTKLLNLATILVLGSMGSAASAQNVFNGKSAINCDKRQYDTRLALDPVQKRIWFVFLDEAGNPNMELPPEIRITEGQLLKIEQGNCVACYRFWFKYKPNYPGGPLMGITSRPDGKSLKIDLFDMVVPENPEQTWNKVSCFTYPR